jgi:hypothetical protein
VITFFCLSSKGTCHHTFDGLHWFTIWLYFFFASWSEYYLFFFSGSSVLPLGGQLFKDEQEVSMLALSRILQTLSMLFLFDNIYCARINSHISKIIYLFKSNYWNEIKEMSVFKKYFWKSILFGQRPNTHH